MNQFIDVQQWITPWAIAFFRGAITIGGLCAILVAVVFLKMLLCLIIDWFFGDLDEGEK